MADSLAPILCDTRTILPWLNGTMFVFYGAYTKLRSKESRVQPKPSPKLLVLYHFVPQQSQKLFILNRSLMPFLSFSYPRFLSPCDRRYAKPTRNLELGTISAIKNLVSLFASCHVILFSIPAVYTSRRKIRVRTSHPNRLLQNEEKLRYSSPERSISSNNAQNTVIQGSLSSKPRRQTQPLPTENGAIATKIRHKKTSVLLKTAKIQPKSNENDIISIMSTNEPKKSSTTILSSNLCVGRIVSINTADGRERLAIISEMTSFHESEVAVVCAWLFTRAQIYEDLIANMSLSADEFHHYLQHHWPVSDGDESVMHLGRLSQHEYMLSTIRTIVVSDSMGILLAEAPVFLSSKICRDTIYLAESAERTICKIDEGSFQWLKKNSMTDCNSRLGWSILVSSFLPSLLLSNSPCRIDRHSHISFVCFVLQLIGDELRCLISL